MVAIVKERQSEVQWVENNYYYRMIYAALRVINLCKFWCKEYGMIIGFDLHIQVWLGRRQH